MVGTIVRDMPTELRFYRLVERFCDWSGGPFAADAAIQLCVCEAD